MKLLNIRSSNILIILIFTTIVNYSFAQEKNSLDSTQKKNISLNLVFIIYGTKITNKLLFIF